MGLMDKLKDAGKTLVDNAKDIKQTMSDYAKENENAVFIDDFKNDGYIESDSLPPTQNSHNNLWFKIDAKNDKLIIVEHGYFGMVSVKTKDKLIKMISLNDIAKFKALSKERRDVEFADSLTYKCEIICNSKERYVLTIHWFEHYEDTIYHIYNEMDGIRGLDAILLTFVDMVSDDYTKQWYNEIYAERGTEPVFDENGKVNFKAHLAMHSAWFEMKNKEWDDRIEALQSL